MNADRKDWSVVALNHAGELFVRQNLTLAEARVVYLEFSDQPERIIKGVRLNATTDTKDLFVLGPEGWDSSETNSWPRHKRAS